MSHYLSAILTERIMNMAADRTGADRRNEIRDLMMDDPAITPSPRDESIFFIGDWVSSMVRRGIPDVNEVIDAATRFRDADAHVRPLAERLLDRMRVHIDGHLPLLVAVFGDAPLQVSTDSTTDAPEVVRTLRLAQLLCPTEAEEGNDHGKVRTLLETPLDRVHRVWASLLALLPGRSLAVLPAMRRVRDAPSVLTVVSSVLFTGAFPCDAGKLPTIHQNATVRSHLAEIARCFSILFPTVVRAVPDHLQQTP